jgi:hypothetical protein
MSQKIQKIRHLSNCHASTEDLPERCAVIDSSSNVSSEKRKEEANQQLYLKRI